MSPAPNPTDERAPELDAYLDEPEYSDDHLPQEDEPADLLIAARGLVTPTAPRSWQETLAWAANESANGSAVWNGLCQKFCRTAPGCPGGASSALDAWFNAPTGFRVVGGKPEDAEPGWQLISRSRNPNSAANRFGHIIIVGRDFADGRQSAWSTDALRVGRPDRINPADLYRRWNHEYLGRIRWQNGLILDIKDVKPEPAKFPYEALADWRVDLERGLRDARRARERAKSEKDGDRKKIQALIDRNLELIHDVQAAYDTLTHKA